MGLAVVLGAFGGVLCGGVLGGFAVAVQALGRRVEERKSRDAR